MIPIFYEANETRFSSFGIGKCSEATRCEVREELNGKYELTLEMPATARHFTEIGARTLIFAKPNPYDQAQPFRIYRPVKSSKLSVTLDAQHISYDLAGYPCIPFTAANALEAIARMTALQVIAVQPFEFATDMTAENVGTMTVSEPRPTRELLGIGENTLVGTYGGALRFDRFVVQLLKERGEDRGFIIAYGKNVVDLEQEQNISDVYNTVFPYARWNGQIYSGDLTYAPGTWDYFRTKAVDFSSEVSSYAQAPTAAQLSALATAWINREKCWEPRVSLKVTTVPPGSEGLESLQDLRLGDTVTVRFLRLGIDVKSMVVAYTYDVLRERYTSIELGEKPRSAAEAISDAARLTKGEISPDRIRGGSIGAGKLTPDLQGAFGKMVTNPYLQAFEVSSFLSVCPDSVKRSFVPEYITINGNSYYVFAANMSTN